MSGDGTYAVRARLSGVRLPPPSHLLAGALCAGLALANGPRATALGVGGAGVGLAALAVVLPVRLRLIVLLLGLALAGWWWGSVRLAALDRTLLRSEIGRAGLARVVVTGPSRRARFMTRALGELTLFGAIRLRERVLLELPAGLPPPQGAIVEALAVVREPRGPQNGFDERAWLRRQGVHAVLRIDRWRQVGMRGGIAGMTDRLRTWLAASLQRGTAGERRALVEAVVLGEDQGLSNGLRRRLRTSGLYHLVAVSGQNVALVAGAVLALAWLAGIPRLLAEVGALAAIGAYVAAVGAQPSVVRAGIAGALVSLAWLSSRLPDRWYALLVGGIVLLAWNPYTLLDAGFELSFSAVLAIFTLAPRLLRVLEGYPLPRPLAGVVAISTACGLATAPVLWAQFGAVPLLSVPANALAAPAVAPLLLLSLASVAIGSLVPGAAAALGWLAGWCAAEIALVARLVGGLPFAQAQGGWAAATVAVLAGVGVALAWRRRIAAPLRVVSGTPPGRRW